MTSVDPPPKTSTGEESSDGPSSRGQRPRRLLPRFGLRSLFIVAILFCLAFGWIGRNLYRVRQEEAAVETLLQAGATLYPFDRDERWPYEFSREQWDETSRGDAIARWFRRIQGRSARPRFESVILHMGEAEESKLRAAASVLPRLSELEKVHLSGPAFDDSACEYLVELPNLEWVSFRYTRVTERGLERLASLPQLRCIELERPDAPHLLTALPHLVHLRIVMLHNVSVSRSDMEGIASLPELAAVRLVRVKEEEEEDQALDPLENATGLRLLYLSSEMPNEKSFAFENLRNLEWLDIRLKHEETLERLVGLPKLRHLDVGRSLDPEALRRFSDRRRGCWVFQRLGDGSLRFFKDGAVVDHDDVPDSEFEISAFFDE